MPYRPWKFNAFKAGMAFMTNEMGVARRVSPNEYLIFFCWLSASNPILISLIADINPGFVHFNNA